MSAFDFIELKINAEEAAKKLQKNAQDATKDIKKNINDLPDKMKNYDIKEAANNTVKKTQDSFNNWKEKNENTKKAVKNALNTETENNDISKKDFLKIIYYLIAVDGKIANDELAEFDEIGKATDKNYDSYKKEIISECKKNIEKSFDNDDYYDNIRDNVSKLIFSNNSAEDGISPKTVLWNLIVVAYSENDYSDVEKKLIRSVSRDFNIDNSVVHELENSMETEKALEKEEKELGNNSRPYSVVNKEIEEIKIRKETIFQNVNNIIAD